MNNKIAILIPYFGTLPPWADLFFLSCQQNNTIDFHFFTDQDLTQYQSSNIHVVRTSLSDYCAAASKKLGVAFTPIAPYKLCDLKPFYGLVHADLLQAGRYAFWGFGDIDLIWGDLRTFLTDQLLTDYDIISNHSDRLSGHLCLLRNSDYHRNLCLKIHHWQQLLTDQKNHALDEQALTLTVYPAARMLWKIHTKLFFRLPLKNEWLSYVRFCTLANQILLPRRRRLLLKEGYTTPFESDLTDPTAAWQYRDGRMYDCRTGRELPYLHFLCLKRHWTPDSITAKDMNRLTITKQGIA